MENQISSDDFMKKTIAKSINQAVIESRDAFDDSFDDPELTDDDTLGPTEVDIQKITDEAEKVESFDIFSLGETYAQQGHTVAYTVKKNGRVFTHIEHPYSWKDMQRKFGAGTYKVTLRLSELNNKYIKTQSQTLADPPAEDAKEDTRNEYRTAVPTSSGPNFNDVFERLERQRREEREQAKQDAKEREDLILKMTEMLHKKEENKGNMTETVTTLLTALSPLLAPLLTKTDSSSSTQTLMLEMQKMNMENQKQQMQTTMELLKAQQEQTKQMFEGLKETISRVAERDEDDGGGFDPKSYLDEIRQAEDRGFEKFKLLNDLADEKAKEKVGAPAKEESTTDILLKSMIPMVGMMFQKGQQVPPPQVAHTPVHHAPQVVDQRRSLSGVHPSSVNRGQVQARTRTVEAPKNGQTESVNTSKPSVSHGKGIGQNTLKKNPIVAEENLGTINHNASYTGKIKDIVIPVIVDAFSSGETDRTKVIHRCINELNTNRIPLNRVGSDFTAGHVEEIISEFGLPVEFSQTLRELHYELLVQTGNATDNRSHA